MSTTDRSPTAKTESGGSDSRRLLGGWQPIDTVPEFGLFIVYEDGAMRMMLRERGEWKSLATALDQYGDPDPAVVVQETGVHEPTHWMALPDHPSS